MTTVLQLTDEYVSVHDLRPASASTYHSSTRAFIRKFGNCLAEMVTHRDVLAWRKQELDRGLSKRSWNTYSSHLRTIFKYGIEEEVVTLAKNPFNKTSVIPPRRKKKTVVEDAIEQARSRLRLLKEEEEQTCKRSSITPAWFWLIVYETFYYTGIRLNALLNVRMGDIDLKHRLIRVRAETEKTHREFMIPIPDGLLPHLQTLMKAAKTQCFSKADQLFNVNRFSTHYRGTVMNVDQVEAMYKKLTTATGARMTPHRFRHTIATDLMKQPDRNIHVTKTLLNHSNLATTMEYIEPDYEMMRLVMNERFLPPGFEYYMSRHETKEQHRVPRLRQMRSGALPLLKIDRTLPPDERGWQVIPEAGPAHRALALPSSNSTGLPMKSPMQALLHPKRTMAADIEEPLSTDEIAFVGKFLDWLRHRGADADAQLLLDSRSSLSEQLKATRGSFEGIAWVNRPS